jgi:positive regulator of sigma E activity
MSDWLHDLPVPVMALVIFGFTYLMTAAIHFGVAALAARGLGKSFKAISVGMLPSLGIIFGLFVAFTAAQVWNDNDRASAAISREASALRSILVFGASFPGEPDNRLHDFVRDYVQQTATVEWPMMAHETATLNTTPKPLAEALQLVLSLPATAAGQQTAQREIVSAIETVLDSRRQRIIVSLAEVNFVKWTCLYLQAACALLVMAMVHCDDRRSSFIALCLFATGVAASVLLIAAHDRPFIGQIAIKPDLLLQIVPGAPGR